MTVEDLGRKLKSQLAPVYGVGEARAMVGLIFFALKGWNQTEIVVHSAAQVSDFLYSESEKAVGRVLAGEPIQYVLGRARFFGMDLKVSPAVLIPRPETEELVELIISENGSHKDLRVLDIGTGSGAIAIALARNLPFSIVTAMDVSAGALSVAGENSSDLHASVNFLHEDIFAWAPPGESFDIIVSNPPYIPEEEKKDMDRNVVDYEPSVALFVPDTDPLVFYRRIVGVASEALTDGGELYLEINSRFPGEICGMMVKAGFEDVRPERDISRRQRFVVGRIRR